MDHKCQGCSRLLLKEDRRKKDNSRFRVMTGAKLSKPKNESPSVRCLCGLRTVLITGRF